ncbi:MAG: InlB B-repeat-containing protein [Verrucomicrobiota bacterium]
MTNFIRPSRAILAAALFAVGAGSVLANSVIYQDSFTTPGTGRGGPYVSSIAGATTTTGGGTWLAGVETSGWGQTGGGRATPTSSNFLAFTPDPGRIYTVQATIDSTGAAGWGDSWFTLGFTSFQHNWTGADGATIDTNDLVRFNQARVATITYTVSGATLSAAGVGYVGWITDNPGNVNLDPNNQQVKITHFSLFSGVANPTITYNGNGSDGGTVPADGSSPFVYGATVTVPGAGSMTRADYAFIGWNTAADGGGMSYSPGGTFTLYDNITLYAKWLPNNYVVLTYDGNGSTGGGAPVDPSSPYLTGSAVTVLGTGSLSKTSHSFAHWNTSADGSGTSYNPNETFTINSSTTLHAQWTPGPDYLWDNGGNSYAWNTTDANWAGAAWGNSASHNALFTTVGGAIMLDAITAGNVDVGAGS